MKYTIAIGGGGEFEVDSMVFGVVGAETVEGWADVRIQVNDEEEDIYTDEKKKVWIEWLDKCCMDKHNPEERIRKVVAKVYGGDDDSDAYRTVTIENGYLDRYVEHSEGDNHSYEATIRRAPKKQGEVKVEPTS